MPGDNARTDAPGRARIKGSPVTDPDRSWRQMLAVLLRGENLSADDTRWAMRQVMDDAAEPAQLAGFLVALRAKGECAEEVHGLLDALMERVIPIPVDGSDVVDIVGTGGDGAHTVSAKSVWTPRTSDLPAAGRTHCAAATPRTMRSRSTGSSTVGPDRSATPYWPTPPELWPPTGT